MNRLGKLTSRLAAVAVTALMMSAGGQAQSEPLKVGFIYVGPIGDHGWSYQHNEGRLAVEKALRDKVQTTYVEKVPEGADAIGVREGRCAQKVV